ncbi:MAG TPA: hypothetical protein DIU15_17100, partial [Deltaproteobacteria bacterium]|nr:hypothetical protein [Deltaproteobacteria bacterium]
MLTRSPARITNRASLLDASLSEPVSARRALALDVLEAGLRAVEPASCTAKSLGRLGTVGFEPGPQLWVLAFGKAAIPMAQAVLDQLPVQGGFVLGLADPDLDVVSLEPLRFLPAVHPLPSPDAAEHGQLVLDWARGLGANDQILCLVSGGGSSMLELPAHGLSLDDLRDVGQVLLESGLPIEVVNPLRSSLSQLKGGKLLAALAPAQVANIVLSDVVTGSLATVASGPTLPRPPAPAMLQDIVDGRLEERLPSTALALLRAAEAGAAANPALSEPGTVVAADNQMACEAMAREARRRGRSVVVLPDVITGLASESGAEFVGRARERGADVVIGGGETTVQVRGSGRGGRNHEFVLGALDNWPGGLL